ncbi:MAG: HIRAN domain-containing protein [Rhodobacteraceae bacterium]|nr:HIRAN domain-containing protein [Paracoccaceae bacterium]
MCETFDGFEPPFTYLFDVAGNRYDQNRYDQLASGERLCFEREPDNQYDPDAIRIVRSDGTRVGYVNRLQTGPVGRWLDDERISASVFRTNGRIEYPRLFVLAKVGSMAQALAA